ncbi:type II toxin-antitoxin system Phd/YefM family antitoxin [Paraburkholderia podalyriae]|uniref:Type II toxin-antitoxin system Phd/YefM family antitoxin n=2 Tax=Paraburkholderia TaxID=1822464 RepID=A0ABR7Q162_9BURK|nr:type II toxin-antitoxin system Phd/YefM family antitoxin [Paraburkholderia podalyriae]MBC8752263.1 type II toxin-antitoxin system Phd/YefM family antitoxin [Paraburkholderia podalyriae]
MSTVLIPRIEHCSRAQDVIPISEASSRRTELAEDVVAGAEKVLTKNGSAYVAIVDARKLNYDHALEAEHGRLVLLHDAEEGLKAALADKVQSEEEFQKSLRRFSPGK